MLLYIIRHADPDYPNKTITAAGHLEARALADRLAGIGLDRIYSSPLPRALHTAQYTVDLTGITPVIENWTQELGARIKDGTCKDYCFWDLHGELIRGCDPLPGHDKWPESLGFNEPEIQGEINRIRKNSDEFLFRHGYVRKNGIYQIMRGNKEKIAVFCHNGFGLIWLSVLLEIPVPLISCGFWLAPSSVTTILFDERSSEFAVPRALAIGDTSHLHKAGLPIQPAGIIANRE